MPSRPQPAPTSRQVISRQLREIIRGRGLTAYALGRRAGLDPGIVQRFLNEERDMKLDSLDRLADVLGLRLAEGSRGRGRAASPSRAARADRGSMAEREAPPAPDPIAGLGPSAQPEADPIGPADAEPPATPGRPGPSEVAAADESPVAVGPPAELPWWET